MKIVVMGTGGTGGYYGGLLSKQGHDVTFIARGEHLAAIQQSGLQIRSLHGDLMVSPAQATDDPSTLGAPDLILFCTKTYDTEHAAREIKSIVGLHTAVVSLQNGIDAAERIGEVVGMRHMIGGATWISSAVEEPGVIRLASKFRRVVIGELNGRSTPRAEAIRQAFHETGVTAELSESIFKVLWTKFVFIAAASSFGSLTRLPVAEFSAVPDTRELITSLMREVEVLAHKLGVDLDPDVVERSLAFMDNAGPTIKASMQLDVEAGHRTEIESMLGVIGRKAREVGLETPVADTLYALLLPLEVKAQAKHAC